MSHMNTPGSLRAALVLGIIGAVFAVFGGLCAAACATAVEVASAGTVDTSIVYVLAFGGAVVSIIGAALCVGKPIPGAVMMLLGAICSFILVVVAFDIMSLFAGILLALATILAFVGAKSK